MFVFSIDIRCITNHIRTGKSDSLFVYSIDIRCITNHIRTGKSDSLFVYSIDIRYWKQTKLSDLPVLIWFVIHLRSILKTNKTIWFTCPYMICYTSDVYTENKQNYLIYLSLYDLLYIWGLYWKQTKLSDLPVLIWFVILLMSILKTNKTIWFTCPYMICYTSEAYIENKQNYLIYLSLYDLLYIWCLCITNHIRTGKSDSFVCFQYRPQMTENKQNYLIYLSLYDLLYIWCLYWKQTKLSDLPVFIWFVIHLMFIL